MLRAWAFAFFVTQATEVPLAMWLVPDRPRARVAVAAILASTLTHPAFWFVAPYAFHDYWTWVIASECVIGLVEGVVYARVASLPLARGVAVSLQVNGASFLLGLGLTAARLWP